MLNNDLDAEQRYNQQAATERAAADKAYRERAAAERTAAKKTADGKATVDRNATTAQAKEKSAKWSMGHTVVLAFLVALIVAVCLLFPRWASGESSGTWRLWVWLLIMALLGGLFVLIGHGIIGLWKGCLIDNRNRISLSRLQQVSWTVLILSAFLTFAAFKIHANPNTDALDIKVPTQVWSLLGISTASLTGAATIKYSKRNLSVNEEAVNAELQQTKLAMPSASEAQSLGSQGILATKETPQDARIADLFRGDEVGSAAQLEVGKVQMFFFTLIMVLAYAINMGTLLYAAKGLPPGLPDVSEGMVVLLLISHAGFLVSKAIPASPTPRAS